MKRVLIFGNSGSGKSTLARKLCSAGNLAHLDLDTLAWLPQMPPRRRPLDESIADILAFIHDHDQWVIEGCYADLLAAVTGHASELIFLDLPVEDCVSNARNRPWEPHKYPSEEAQNANLEMLIDWIRQYDSRSDTFSKAAHQALYEGFTGPKTRLTSNRRDA